MRDFIRVVLIVCFGVYVTLASGQETLCDPLLLSSGDHPQRYEQRDNRCEGIYVQEVSSSVIALASFTTGFESFDTTVPIPLEVSWPPPTVVNVAGSYRLRSESTVRRLYYRMDTAVPDGTNTFTWSTDVLGALELERSDIGVYGWAPVQLAQDEDKQDVYFPVSVSQQEASTSDAYRLVVMPKEDLEELSYYVASSSEGFPEETLIDETPLNYNYYPNNRPIDFALELPAGTPEGVYYLELIAERERGGSSTLDLLFYHAGS